MLYILTFLFAIAVIHYLLKKRVWLLISVSILTFVTGSAYFTLCQNYDAYVRQAVHSTQSWVECYHTASLREEAKENYSGMRTRIMIIQIIDPRTEGIPEDVETASEIWELKL